MSVESDPSGQLGAHDKGVEQAVDTGSRFSLQAVANVEFTPGSQASGAHGRLFYLDSPRALAALYVVAGHIGLTIAAPWRPLQDLLEDGDLSVALFIVVSGFSLGIAATRSRDRRYRTFIRRRAWRILPPYWAALALSIILTLTVIPTGAGTIWSDSAPISWPRALINVAAFQDFSHTIRSPDYPVWSIAVEWHLYFFFPLLFAIASRRFGRVAALVVGLCATGLLWIPWDHVPALGFPPALALLFVVGALASTLVSASDGIAMRVRAMLSPSVATGLGICGILLGVLFARQWQNHFLGDVCLGLGVAPLLVGYARAPEYWGRRLLEVRPLVWLGFFSYSLYLVHAPIIQVVWQYVVHPLHLGPRVSFALIMVMGPVAAVLVAFVFHLIFERPFINYRTWNTVVSVYRNPRRLFMRSSDL